ncbi:MAG: metallophosphoesterase [Burkholderiales bacterium]|nr:metallophosphoesterase [Burkholderiales bacterium]
MRLLLLSDLHLEVAPLALPDPGPFDVAVLAGDIHCRPEAIAEWVRASPVLRRARAVLLVPGNHEYYDGSLNARAAALRAAAAAPDEPPLHLLDGHGVVIGGVRFVGCTLWTDFELRIDTPQGTQADPARGIAAAERVVVDYRAIGWDGAGEVRRLTPQDTLELHRAQRAWLLAALQVPFAGPTVVVTHHGPHRGSLAPRYAADWVSTAFISELPAAFFAVPVLWVHGHTHTSRDYRVGGCRVVCNPRGYAPAGRPLPENPAFDPAFVVAVDAGA